VLAADAVEVGARAAVEGVAAKRRMEGMGLGFDFDLKWDVDVGW
jgi:hypothetical protein